MQSPTRSITQSQLTIELETYLGELLFDQLQLAQEKDEIIAQAVHDLRGPITNLKLYMYLLERADAEQQAKYVAVLKDCIAELARMTGDLMEQVRPNGGHHDPFSDTPLH